MGGPLTIGQDAFFTAGPRHGWSGCLFFPAVESRQTQGGYTFTKA